MTEIQDYKNYRPDREEETPFFCKFTFGQFFTILVLEVVTLAFVFYLGAKYGTNYLKISNDENTPAVTEVVAGNVTGSAQQAATAPELPEAAKDSEIQAMARDVVQGNDEDLKTRVKALLDKRDNQAPQAKEQAAGEQQPASVAPTPQAADAKQAEMPLDNAKEDSSVIKAKSSANAQYSIQVGSYPNMDEASSKIEDWRGKGYPAFMMIADIPDRGRWYRVRIGGFASKEDAQKYLDQFKTNEGTEAIVVLNEQ